MMAEKARLFGDEATRRAILAADTSAKAKRLGRAVQSFREPEWADARYRIVVRGNIAKFTQNPELGTFLAETDEHVLVEASPDDRIWGIGLANDDPRAQDPTQWQGRNLLGFALMEARHHVRTARSEPSAP